MTGASERLRVQAVRSLTDAVADAVANGVDDGALIAWFAGSWAGELADLDAEQAIETANRMMKYCATCGSAFVMRDFIVLR